MAQYSMTCSCGHEYSVDAESKDQAIDQLKGMMPDDKIAEHFAEKHPGDPVPTREQADGMIEQMTKEA